MPGPQLSCLSVAPSRSLLFAVLVLIGCSFADDPHRLVATAEESQETIVAQADDKPNDKKSETAVDLTENPFPRRFPAPALDGGKDWLNTNRALSIQDLRGKVVLLDFWTYCCINCMHVIPDLQYLEKKYPNELVVIGVHSAKFENEKESDNIRQAILRYEIEHPVINDANMTIWRKFNVHSWPTLVLIDPEGQYCGYISGEGNREILDQVVGKLIAYHTAKGTLDPAPLKFDLEKAKQPPTPLFYPGKILADAAGNRLFISDSNHNRIVISDLEGKLLEVIGTGAIGKADGAYDTAQFDHPQGIYLDGNTLYVADTENHLLRAIDLEAKTVRTIAGTGVQMAGRGPGGPALKTEIASPWDVLLHKGKLYICMAGPHQIWTLDFKSNKVEPYAGSGREDITNGTLSQSALAQPSGMATDGKFLYICDSEGSAIRSIPLDPRGKVTTVVGTSDLPQGRSLFEFGDRDGIGGNARLQHPLGIAIHNGQLYVADTYNHKIKLIDLKNNSSKTFLGTGTANSGEEPGHFSEPAGLSIAGDFLYVADTNNHRIRVVDLKTKTARTLTIAGLEPPPADAPTADPDADKAITVDPVGVKVDLPLEIEVDLKIPEGYKLNPLMPVTFRWSADQPQQLVAAEELGARQEAVVEGTTARMKLPITGKSGAGVYKLMVTWSFCKTDEKNGLCKIKTQAWKIPVAVDPAGAGKLQLSPEP